MFSRTQSPVNGPAGEVLLRALGGFGRKYRKLRQLLGLCLGDRRSPGIPGDVSNAEG